MLSIIALAIGSASAQPLDYSISTIAGGSTNYAFAEGKPANTIFLADGGFSGAAMDRQGNFYFSTGRFGNRVIRVRPDGSMTAFAGSGDAGFNGDGIPATSAQLSNPLNVVLDPQGRVVFFDIFNYRIRRVETDGTISTIAGNGQRPTTTLDGEGGLATAARVYPTFGAFNSAGDLYFIDFADKRNIRKVSAAGRITTVAQGVGFGIVSITSDGTNVYVADNSTQRVNLLKPDGTLFTVAGSTAGSGGDGGLATSAQLTNPASIAADADGTLYIADSGNQRIRMVRNDPANGTVAQGKGIISVIAGTGVAGFGQDGDAASRSPVSYVGALSSDGSGSLVTTDAGSGRYRIFRAGGIFRSLAGLPRTDRVGDGGPAVSSLLDRPRGLVREPNGGFLLTGMARARRVAADATIATIAGAGWWGNTGDSGPALSATFLEPSPIAEDSAGNIYISDYTFNNVRKITPDQIIHPLLSNASSAAEGQAGSVSLRSPQDLITDSQNNLYLAEFYAIRKLTPSGAVSIFAGANAAASPAASGPRNSAYLSGPRGIAFTPDGSLIVADTNNNRILRFAPNGPFTTLAGTFGKSGSPATAAPRHKPCSPHPAASPPTPGAIFTSRTGRTTASAKSWPPTTPSPPSPGLTPRASPATMARP